MVDILSKIIASIAALATVVLGIFAIERTNKIKRLKQEIEDLKRRILRSSSKVDPETNRVIILEAKKSIQFFGINATGPLHHCREELIQFLNNPRHTLQIALLDPDSKEFEDRAKRENDSIGRIHHELGTSIRILKDISLINN